MNIQEESRKLSKKYIDAVYKLEDFEEEHSKEEHEKNDSRLKDTIIFLEELLGTRLELNYSEMKYGNWVALQKNKYNYYDRVFDYPRFNDKIVEEYIRKISEKGIDQASQEWLDSNYHQKAKKIYQANSGKDSDCHNSLLAIIAEIRDVKFFYTRMYNMSKEDKDKKLEFLYDALTDEALITEFECKGVEKASQDYYEKHHPLAKQNDSEKDPIESNNPSIDIGDDGLPF